MAKNPNVIKEPVFDRVFYAVTFVILLLLLVVIMYPLWFVVMASLSDAQYVNNGTILLYPKGLTWLGYERTFHYPPLTTGRSRRSCWTACLRPPGR